MYNNGAELLELTKEHNCPISEIVIAKEKDLFDLERDDVYERSRRILGVMGDSSSLALDEKDKYTGHIIGGDAYLMNEHAKADNSFCGSAINKAMARAFSSSEVNASMGQICAAPTAGSCGIIPAAVFTGAEICSADEDQMIRAILTSSAVGEIITKNACVSGAEGGCQAECGSAAAMAAAGLVEMRGGTPEQALNASAIALKNIMGLVCDPIAGLVEAPCAKRNASGVVNAMISADMALAGVKSIIPFDEVVEAMYKVGKALPSSLKETALGGVAVSKTGKEIAERVYGEV